MLKLNLPDYYAKADEATKQQLYRLAVEEAFKGTVSQEELEQVKISYTTDVNRLLALMAKSDADLDKRLKVLENKKSKSRLENLS